MLGVALRRSAILILPTAVHFWPDNIAFDLPFSLPFKFQAVYAPVIVSEPVAASEPVAVSESVVASEPAAPASRLRVDTTEDISPHQSASRSHILLVSPPMTNSAPLSPPSLHLSESRVISSELIPADPEPTANIEPNRNNSPPDSDPIGKATPTFTVTMTLPEVAPPSTVTVIQVTEQIITIRESSMSIVVHYLIAFTAVSLGLTAFYRLVQFRVCLNNLWSKRPKEALVMVDKQDQEQLEGKAEFGSMPGVLSPRGAKSELVNVPTTLTDEQEL